MKKLNFYLRIVKSELSAGLKDFAIMSAIEVLAVSVFAVVVLLIYVFHAVDFSHISGVDEFISYLLYICSFVFAAYLVARYFYGVNKKRK